MQRWSIRIIIQDVKVEHTKLLVFELGYKNVQTRTGTIECKTHRRMNAPFASGTNQRRSGSYMNESVSH